MIPYGKQSISDEDIQEVVNVLRSDWITQGPAIARFEDALSTYCGAAHAVAISNATTALHLACLAADLGKGDILWTSPNSFVASANCGLYCGAMVDFVDIDPVTYNMSVAHLKAKLDAAIKTDTLPKVLIPVHFSGQSCDMKAVYELVKPYGITIIEDASHAIGGDYLGGKIGNCTYSDMTVFSFHPVKIITTGEGGAITTNNADLDATLKRLRSHGITRDPACMTKPSEGDWYYQQIELGYNYRMTDIQAALGASQLKKVDLFIRKRRELAQIYTEKLAGLPLILPAQEPCGQSAWHLYVIQLDATKTQKSRQEIFTALRQNGIGVNVHYIPIHTQPYYQKMGFSLGDFPASETYYAQAISLPLYYGLEEKDQQKVVDVLKKTVFDV